jgi:predicted phosphodiesterase
MKLALIADIHGNVLALEAALVEIKKQSPDRIAVLGDLVLNGPRPAETVDRVRELEADGALVIAGNTDIAVADGDYAAAFPWLDEVPAGHRAAAEWSREQLSDDQLEYLRRLPAERRIAVGEELVLACHASPGSQTSGLPAELDAAVATRMSLTFATLAASCWSTPAPVATPSTARPTPVGGCSRSSRAASPARSSSGPATTPSPSPRRSVGAACPAMSTVPPPSVPGGSSDDLRCRWSPRGRDGYRCRHATGQ